MKDHAATLQDLIEALSPAIKASLDGVCILNKKCEIVHANVFMRLFLKMSARDLKEKKVFCDLIKLSCCSEQCRIESAMSLSEELRYDELPASVKNQKMRVMIKSVPLFVSSQPDPVGSILTVRDTTAEILVQAKYHKLSMLLEEKRIENEELRNKLRKLYESFKNRALVR